MKNILLTATMLTALNLSDKSSEDDAAQAFQDLIDKAAKVPGLEQDLLDKSTALTNKEKELNDLKAASTAKEVQDLLAQGETDKKLTKELSEKLAKSFAGNPEGLKDLIASMPAQVVVTELLDNEKALADFTGKTWDDLYKSDKLEEVRVKFPDLYEKLRAAKYEA